MYQIGQHLEFWLHGYAKKVFPKGHFKFKDGRIELGFYEKNKYIENKETIESYDVEIAFIAKEIQWEDYII